MHALVIVPTYNERANLPLLVPAILAVDPGLHVLIVDDNSPDGTGHAADELAAREPRVAVLHRPGKQGLGSAYVAGFDHALRARYEHVIEMDADFSHRPEDLRALLAAAPTADVIIGSRNIPGGRTVGWSRARGWLSKGGSRYVRALLRLPLHDCTGGFKCFRRSALERLDLTRLHARGFAFQVEVNYACHRAGLRMREVPIVFADRFAGRSKMTAGIAVEALLLVLALRLGLIPAAVAREPAAAPKAAV